jgi:hypothetical protein
VTPGEKFSDDTTVESILLSATDVVAEGAGRLRVTGHVHFSPVLKGSVRLPDCISGEVQEDGAFDLHVAGRLTLEMQVRYRWRAS